MKKSLLLLLLLVAGAMNAQVVNIPDTVLKNELITGYNTNYEDVNGNPVNDVDANNDGQIQVSEAQNIRLINFDYTAFSNLTGLEAFTNLKVLEMPVDFANTALDVSALTSLEELTCPYLQNLASINVSGLINLKKLHISGSDITTLNLSGLTALEELYCGSGYDINTLTLSGNTNLKRLDCVGNNLTTLDLSDCTSLEWLSCNNNNISVLDISACANLKKLYCTHNNISELHVEGLAHLEDVRCDFNEISNVLDFSAANQLNIFFCDENHVPGIVINDKPLLEIIYIGFNELEELVLGNMPSLTSLVCGDNNLQSLDVSQCPNLDVLSASGNSLTYINLKNGNAEMDSFSVMSFSDDPEQPVSEVYVCTDEGEEEMVVDYFAMYNMSEYVNVSTYCSFTPGGDYNTISGNVYLECGTATPVAGFVSVNINDGTETGIAYTNTGGYSFYTQGGAFTLTPQVSGSWFTVSPATATVNFADSNSNTTTQNFCLTANGVHNDVDVLIVPVVPAQPGFDAVYKIVYTNKGNQTLSGAITFTYNDTVLDYESASIVEASSATGSLTWNYSSLLPFESREIMVTLNLNGPMETPAVNIDDELDFSATVYPVSGDETPDDNTFGLKQVVVGSYDPNDITCLEGETVHPDQIGEYLHYNINFENTGTAPATFIVVKDVIDEEKFDVSSLQLINASHDVEVRVTGNKVEFYFDAINLAANGGKGNVVFKIKTLNTLAVNSDVTQQANIYFDYNWPIVTNEATTTFTVLNTHVFDKDGSIKVYPNPAVTAVTISADSTLKGAELYDVQGRLLQFMPASGTSAALDISGRGAGIYFVKIFTEKGSGIEKVIKL